VADLISLDGIFNRKLKNLNLAYGFQLNKESLDIYYDEVSRAAFDKDGKLIKTADLFFLGGGINLSKSRTSNALFFEIEKSIQDVLDLRIAARYESMKNESSFDPKISLKYMVADDLTIRFSKGTAFSAPSMAQMYSSEINLGSVRDINDSVFVRQASTGNPNLKPATSTNSNIGMIFQRNDLRISLDFWKIEYEDRVEVESAQAILSSNPFGPSITRNEFGDLIGVTTTYFNEDNTLVKGTDLQIQYLINLKQSDLSINLMGTNLSDFKTPSLTNQNLMVNRVGKFNFDTHTFSLPKKRINFFTSWDFKDLSINLNSRYLDGYVNERPITGLGLTYGYSNQVKSFLVHDISLNKKLFISSGDLDLRLYLSNIFDKSAPRLYDAPDFSFDTRLHDPRGRILGFNVEYNF